MGTDQASGETCLILPSPASLGAVCTALGTFHPRRKVISHVSGSDSIPEWEASWGPFHPAGPLLMQRVMVILPPTRRALGKDRTKTPCSLSKPG